MNFQIFVNSSVMNLKVKQHLFNSIFIIDNLIRNAQKFSEHLFQERDRASAQKCSKNLFQEHVRAFCSIPSLVNCVDSVAGVGVLKRTY